MMATVFLMWACLVVLGVSAGFLAGIVLAVRQRRRLRRLDKDLRALDATSPDSASASRSRAPFDPSSTPTR